MQIINGKQIAKQNLIRLAKQIKQQKIAAHLAVILVGRNPASQLYVNIKEKRAKKIGLKFTKYLLPSKTKQNQLIQLIQNLNKNKKITAILVQLPLPFRFNSDKIIANIKPNKDADAIHPYNLFCLVHKQNSQLLPATTGAIVNAIKSTHIDLKNKSIAIVGTSKIVGLPTYYYLKNKCRQISIYNKETKNLAQKTKQADILIVAIGQANFITTKYIKKNALVIDVGINKINHKTIGDVNFNSVRKKAAWLTPVPGGIGPITVSQLLENVLILKQHQLTQNK